MIGLGLGLFKSSVRGGGAPSLLTQASAIVLAANGALYDPSDLTSLYQSRTGGSTGASGSVVGIMLDKSHMGGQTAADFIAGQAELVTNGGFATDTAWTKVNTTISGGALNFPGVATQTAQQSCGLVAGRFYEITWTQTTSGGQVFVYLGTTSSADARYAIAKSGSGAQSAILQCSAGDYVRLNLSTSATGTIDNVSIKEIPGFHAVAPSDAARPLLTVSGGLAYLTADGFDDWMNVLPTLNLGEQWWHVGGWKVDGVAAFGYLFAAVNSYRSAVYYTAGAGDAYSMRNAADTANVALVSGTETTTNVFSLTQTSSTAATGWINAGGSTGPQAIYNASAILKGLALFSNNNTTFGQGLAGRFYGGAFAPGALTAGDRAILEQLMAEKSGVTLA